MVGVDDLLQQVAVIGAGDQLLDFGRAGGIQAEDVVARHQHFGGGGILGCGQCIVDDVAAVVPLVAQDVLEDVYKRQVQKQDVRNQVSLLFVGIVTQLPTVPLEL